MTPAVDDLRLTLGSGNVFADLGFPEPKTHMLKAKLVTHLREIVGTDVAAQADAGAMIGLDVQELRRVFQGHFHDVSMEQLISLAQGLGHEVDLVVATDSQRQTRAVKAPAKTL